MGTPVPHSQYSATKAGERDSAKPAEVRMGVRSSNAIYSWQLGGSVVMGMVLRRGSWPLNGAVQIWTQNLDKANQYQD